MSRQKQDEGWTKKALPAVANQQQEPNPDHPSQSDIGEMLERLDAAMNGHSAALYEDCDCGRCAEYRIARSEILNAFTRLQEHAASEYARGVRVGSGSEHPRRLSPEKP